ncbi:hypothetical protein [Micromonospora sp. NPDC049679]|uniref:CBU_0592 family membrane protein n=1 Tax=Micromonospora sp. NPDC049679 TaxID=3155920 RepID=UPI003401FA63
MTFLDFIEIIGALFVLAAFAATQLRRMDPHATSYLVLNVIGAGTLAGIAVTQRSWGFLLLEGTWAIVSLVALISPARRRERRTARHPG